MGRLAAAMRAPNSAATAGSHAEPASQSSRSAAQASASVSRTGTGPTDPNAQRTVRCAVSATRAQLATAMTMALRTPIFRNSAGPRHQRHADRGDELAGAQIACASAR